MNFAVQQLVKIGKQPVAFQAGYRYYVDKPRRRTGLGTAVHHHVPIPEKELITRVSL